MNVHNYEQETIAAIATASAPSAIGIVKISGSNAKSIMQRLFQPKNSASLQGTQKSGTLVSSSGAYLSPPSDDVYAPVSHKMYYGWVIDPATGAKIDEVMAVFMQAPRSYTKEDVCELHCHGGPAVTEKILHLVLLNGARPAMPGEFTKRAMLSGRIDLRQAESVCELCEARTEAQRQAAFQALMSDDQLQMRIASITDACIAALAWVEASIDFPEEDIKTLGIDQLEKFIIKDALEPIQAILAEARCTHLARNGAKIVLTGRPNVGKSSLFNTLLGSTRVIVSPVPGTTRDSIEEALDIDGFLVTITDTAGIRFSEDLIEQEGVKIAKATLQNADHILAIFDLTTPLTQEDHHILQEIPDNAQVTIVLNKSDCLTDPTLSAQKLTNELRSLINGRQQPFNLADMVAISCKTRAGIEQLKKTVKNTLFNAELPDFSQQISLNLRQRTLMEKVLRCLERAWHIASLKTSVDENSFAPELVAIELRQAVEKLQEFSGNNIQLDILDHIFEKFCIGK